MTRARVVLAAVLVAVMCGVAAIGISTATSASAARLTVATAPEVKLTSLQKCAAAMNAGTPVVKTDSVSTTAVTVKAVPAACAGLPMTIKLHDANGATIAQGTVASVAATQTVTVGTHTPANVATAIATIGGWIFPTTWTIPMVVSSCVGLDSNGNVTGIPCTLTINTVNTWTAGPYYYSQFTFVAQTTAPLWRVTFNFADKTYFQGFKPTVVANSQNVALSPGYSCTQLPIFTGQEANPLWGSPNGDLTISNDPAASTQPGALCK